MGVAVSLGRWILLYLATGPSFTRRVILAFYGGGLVIVALVLLAAALVVADGISALLR